MQHAWETYKILVVKPEGNTLKT